MRRFPDAVSIVIDGCRHDRSARQQCALGAFQSRKLSSFQMKLDECGQETERINVTCPNLRAAGIRNLRCITQSLVEYRLAFVGSEDPIVHSDARIVPEPRLQVLRRRDPVRRVRFDGYDLAKRSFALRDERLSLRCRDGLRHPAEFRRCAGDGLAQE